MLMNVITRLPIPRSYDWSESQNAACKPNVTSVYMSYLAIKEA